MPDYKIKVKTANGQMEEFGLPYASKQQVNTLAEKVQTNATEIGKKVNSITSYSELIDLNDVKYHNPQVLQLVSTIYYPLHRPAELTEINARCGLLCVGYDEHYCTQILITQIGLFIRKINNDIFGNWEKINTTPVQEV